MLKITSHLPPPSHQPPTHTHTNSKLDWAAITASDKRYYVTSSIEKDVDRLIEDLDKAFSKYRGAYHIGSKSKISEARKRKGAEKTGTWSKTKKIPAEREKD